MGTGEQAGAEVLEPGLGPVLLALGTVSVPAGMIGVVEGAAVVAGADGATEGWSAAPGDVLQGSPVRGQHPTLEGLQEGGTGAAEDLRQLHHDR